jgi:hypothetical protein
VRFLILATELLTHVANSARMLHTDTPTMETFVLSARLPSHYTMTNIKYRRTHHQWSDVCFPERAKQGETYTSSGICHDGKSPAFCALQDRKSAESSPGAVAQRIIRRYAPHPSLLLGAALRAFVAVARRRHSGPENKRDPH